MMISLVLAIRTVASRERIAKGVKRLPRGDWWRVLRPRCVHRMFDKLHFVYVARAVRKDPIRRNANNEHGTWVLVTQRIIFADLSRAVHAESLWLLEVQEHQPNMGIDKDVSPRSVHTVTVEIGNGHGA